MIAKMPTIAAMAYKYAIGQPFVAPRNDLDYASNFLYMMFGVPCEAWKVNPALSRAIIRILLLHADHGPNASASTVRLAGSPGANPFACIAVLRWPLVPAHGANEAALKMLMEIGTADRIPLYIKRAKDKKDKFRLTGFGHRVYKTYDPRARIMKEICKGVFAKPVGNADIQNPWLLATPENHRFRRALFAQCTRLVQAKELCAPLCCDALSRHESLRRYLGMISAAEINPGKGNAP